MDFYERMLLEKEHLAENIFKIERTLDDPLMCTKIREKQQVLMGFQAEAMKQYYDVLTERIQDLKQN